MRELRFQADDVHNVLTRVLTLLRLSEVGFRRLNVAACGSDLGAYVEVVLECEDEAVLDRISRRVSQIVGVTGPVLLNPIKSPREAYRRQGDASVSATIV